ncbi:hypothetical protein NL676_010949 [Syzygium grande]|nr:hypothetical protein NL676_010949 [Syzygium grande]
MQRLGRWRPRERNWAGGKRKKEVRAGGLRGRVVLHGEADCVSRRTVSGVGGDMVVGCWREKGKEREHVGREQGQHKVACIGNKGEVKGGVTRR